MNKERTLKRMGYIDFLKFIGIMCIILAHVNPPKWLFMLRNFDVPLMVIISAMLGQKSFQKCENKGVPVWRFCVERLKRLVLPTWIFLILYFLIQCFQGNVYSLTYYIDSFLLTQYGTGYVWVVLIYLYAALLIPLCSKSEKYKITGLFVGFLYLIYEIMCRLELGLSVKAIESTFYYIVPYGVLTFLGFNYWKYKKKTKIGIIVVATLIFLAYAFAYWRIYGDFQDVQIAKYSPKAYYLAYGVLVTFILLALCENLNTRLYRNKIIVFTAKHSMWIYLWHILVLKFYEDFKLPDRWYVKYLAVYIMSLIIVFIINKILDLLKLEQKLPFLQYLRY